MVSKTLNMWRDVLLESADSFGSQLVGAIPPLLGVILLLIIGYIIARFGSSLTKKFVEKTNLNQIAKGESEGVFNAILQGAKISDVAAKFVYVLIGLVFVIMATETLGWNIVSEQLERLINYLPKLFGAIALVLVGLVIAQIIRNAIYVTGTSMSLPIGRMLSSTVYYLLLYVVIISALSHAEIDVSILKQNSSIIFAGLMLSFAIAYGWSSKEVTSNLISSALVRQKFRSGETIQVAGCEGILLRYEGLQVVLQDGVEEIYLPVKVLLTEKVEVLK